MTDTEATQAGIETARRRLYFRVDNSKSNLAPAQATAWFHLASVDLANGDKVGVVTQWKWPDPLDGITANDLRAAQQAVAAGGPWRENSQATDWVGKPIAAALKLDASNKAHKKKISGLLKVWIKSGMFVRVERYDPKRREKHPCIEVGEWATD
jgi:hypothetical protein